MKVEAIFAVGESGNVIRGAGGSRAVCREAAGWP